VVVVEGALAAYLPRGEREMWTFLPADEPARSAAARSLAAALAGWAVATGRAAVGWDSVDDTPLARSPLAPFLAEAGFVPSGTGFRLRPAPRE
jgi:ATP-dependent Lhr-like helicase